MSDLPPNCILVDTPSTLSQTIAELYNLPITLPPSLYVDLEGVDLCRNGRISLIQIYASPTSKTYLVDVFTLGASTFLTTSTNGKTLKMLLEDVKIPKVFFDCRNDNDALWNLYQIDTGGVHDLQLMEIAIRKSGRRQFVSGLARAITDYAELGDEQSEAWNDAKTRGKNLFSPEKGGDWTIFEKRPLSKDLIDYCVQDVSLLPRLWKVFDARLTPAWRGKVETEVFWRLQLAKQEMYYGSNGRAMARSPW